MKFALLGGSFNPIHSGHLYLADLALSSLNIDKLILVPANISPFKQTHYNTAASVTNAAENGAASGADRLDMILASITADPRIIVDDLELRRGGVSYTIDTLREIIARYRPRGKPALIIGDDLIADFHLWKEANEIAALADIVIARRVREQPDTSNSTNEPSFPFPHTILDNKAFDVSSGQIRDLIAKGGPWRSFVPQGAAMIIQERGLYGASGNKGKISLELIARVEAEARANLSAKRFIHSRNTALLAEALAARHGFDENAAYLAGIAHDMAKKTEPGIGHGKAAAVLLQERFGIHNKEIREAIEFHTTGAKGMGDLAKAVFIADKIEYSRKGQEKLREWAFRQDCAMDDLFYAVLKDTLSWLKKEGIEPSKESLYLLDEVHK